MKRESWWKPIIGAPQVAYRETIRKAVKAEYKHAKQSGGKGQYGHVVIEMEPMEPGGEGYEFIDEIKGGGFRVNSFRLLIKVFVTPCRTVWLPASRW